MKGRSLIVDDDKSMCDMLATGLKKRGFDPVCVLNGRDALDLLSTQDFDVVVTDVRELEAAINTLLSS